MKALLVPPPAPQAGTLLEPQASARLLLGSPAKGIGLSLVSAGGSGVLFMAAAVGLLASVARQAADAGPKPRPEPPVAEGSPR